MRRIELPLGVLFTVLCVTGLGAFVLGLLFRTAVPDNATQSKALAAQAMATALDLLREPKQVPRVQRFTVPRPFSSAGGAVGFTIQPLEPTTYLVRSDDQEILLLLQQQADGTGKQCLMHPPGIQVGSCQMGINPTKKP
jgi:hypothetical protein